MAVKAIIKKIMRRNDRPGFTYSGGTRLDAGEYDRCVREVIKELVKSG